MMLDPFFLEHGVLLGGRYVDLIYAFVAAEGNLGLVKHIVEILLANLFFCFKFCDRYLHDFLVHLITNIICFYQKEEDKHNSLNSSLWIHHIHRVNSLDLRQI
jgi:hypothetical protein